MACSTHSCPIHSRLSLYTLMHPCTHARTVRARMEARTHTRTDAQNVCAHTCAYAHICPPVRMHTRTYTRTHARTHMACTHAHARTHAHVCTYTRTGTHTDGCVAVSGFLGCGCGGRLSVRFVADGCEPKAGCRRLLRDMVGAKDSKAMAPPKPKGFWFH